VPMAGGGERDPDLIVRWSDSSNLWLVHLTASGEAIQLMEFAGGVGTVRVTQTYWFASGTSYGITVTANGATITVSVNGVQEISYSSATSNETATKVGLWLYAVGSSAACSWDSFVVTGAGGERRV